MMRRGGALAPPPWSASSPTTRASSAPPSSSRRRSPSAWWRSPETAPTGPSVLVAAYAEARILGRLRPGSFRPRPRSKAPTWAWPSTRRPSPRDRMPAFPGPRALSLQPAPEDPAERARARWGREEAEELLRWAGVDGGRRAEELGLGEWVGLFSAR